MSLAKEEEIALIPKGETVDLSISAPSKVYAKPNYPESTSSKQSDKQKSANNSDTSRKSQRSTGSQTLPRGVQPSSFRLPPINTAESPSTFQLKRVGVPTVPIAAISPVIRIPGRLIDRNTSQKFFTHISENRFLHPRITENLGLRS